MNLDVILLDVVDISFNIKILKYYRIDRFKPFFVVVIQLFLSEIKNLDIGCICQKITRLYHHVYHVFNG